MGNAVIAVILDNPALAQKFIEFKTSEPSFLVEPLNLLICERKPPASFLAETDDPISRYLGFLVAERFPEMVVGINVFRLNRITMTQVTDNNFSHSPSLCASFIFLIILLAFTAMNLTGFFMTIESSSVGNPVVAANAHLASNPPPC
jgi:flagellar biosynthesis protein FliQ